MLPENYYIYCMDYAIQDLIANRGFTSDQAHERLEKKICEHLDAFVEEIVEENK